MNADLWSGLRGSLDGWRKNGTLARSEAWRKAMGMATSLPVINPATGALIRQHAMINPAERCATSRMLCAGQVCIAAKRIIAVDGIYERFRDLLLAQLESYVMADPAEAECRLGPRVREDLRNTVHEQVNASVAAGADLIRGGSLPDRDGWWYAATVLENVHSGMPAFDDELFGPVTCIVRAEDASHALALAGNTRLGLGGAMFSADTDHATRLAAEQIDAGCLAINDFVRSDPRVPFGGTKASGFGRELGRLGIHELVNLKTIVIAKD